MIAQLRAFLLAVAVMVTDNLVRFRHETFVIDRLTITGRIDSTGRTISLATDRLPVAISVKVTVASL